MNRDKDEIITIHIHNEEGKTVSKIDVPLSELVKCYMNVHFPLKKNNCTVEKDCVYVQALNEKNARKKLIKIGYRL